MEKTATAVARKRILIIDDHPTFRHGIAAVINSRPDLEICGEASTARAGLDQMRKLNPDLILVDISLPGANGLELLKSIRAESPDVPMLALSMHDEALYAGRAIRAGALGYVSKSAPVDSILEAIRSAIDRTPYLSEQHRAKIILDYIRPQQAKDDMDLGVLSDRELEVFTLLGRGRGTQEIADELHLGLKTIETHQQNIRGKLRFSDGRQLRRFAIIWHSQQNGMEPPAALVSDAPQPAAA